MFRSNSRKKPSENEEESRAPLAGFARYSNIIYLLIGSIGISFGIGYALDYWLHFTFPVFRLVCSIGGIVLGLYLVFKELNSK